jgi:hypothetical protein
MDPPWLERSMKSVPKAGEVRTLSLGELAVLLDFDGKTLYWYFFPGGNRSDNGVYETDVSDPYFDYFSDPDTNVEWKLL